MKYLNFILTIIVILLIMISLQQFFSHNFIVVSENHYLDKKTGVLYYNDADGVSQLDLKSGKYKEVHSGIN